MRYGVSLDRGLLVSLAVGLLCLSSCDSFDPIEKRPSDPYHRVDAPGITVGHSPLSEEDFSVRVDPNYGKKSELRFLRAPKLRSLDIPLSIGMNSIWGATGRDHLGRIYLGVAAWDGGQDPSASLWRYSPNSDGFENLGDVNRKLDELGIRRTTPFPETQIKIHSKILQASDRRMYFATQDEHQEKEDGSNNAWVGGRLFALDLDTNGWECIHTAPEGLIALTARSRYVVAQGYFGHVLYQYDVESKTIRSKRLGTYKGHVSRNVFMDRRMHVYGIRARLAQPDEKVGVYSIDQDRVRVSLVELDPELNEIRDWPLEDYLLTGTTSSEGITGFCELKDGSIVFVTQTGSLWKVSINDQRADLERLGWIDSRGSAFCGGLFSPFGERYVCGFTIEREGAPYVWNVFDLELRESTSLKLDRESQLLLQRPHLLTYGTETLDHQSRAYVVGWRQVGGGKAPHVLQVSWE